MSITPKRLWLAGASALVVAAGAATWALMPGESPDPYPEHPEAYYFGVDDHAFEDLATMTATSALLVKGSVTETAPGETRELGDGSGAVATDREVVIAVEEVLYNRYGVAEPETVVMLEGYWSDGTGYTLEGMPWVEVGDSGYFYLSAPPPEHRDGDRYSLIHLSGRVLIEEDQEVAIAGHWTEEGPWAAAELSTASAEAVEVEIEAAAESALAGAVEPLTVTVCEPSDPEDENSEPVCREE
jgi:hypothetical protein